MCSLPPTALAAVHINQSRADLQQQQQQHTYWDFRSAVRWSWLAGWDLQMDVGTNGRSEGPLAPVQKGFSRFAKWLQFIFFEFKSTTRAVKKKGYKVR